MRYLSIIVGLLLLAGCGSAWKLRRAQKLINSAIENGAKVDSLKVVKYDTIYLPEFKTKLEYVRTVDTVKLIEKCKDLVKSPSKTKAAAIQEEICPELAIDSTFLTTLSVQGNIVRVPVRVVLKANKGHLSGSLHVPPITVPVKTETTTVGVSSGYTFFGMVWRVLFGVIVGFAFCWVLKLLKVIA